MGTAQTAFEVEQCGAVRSPEVTGNDVTGTGSREPEMKGR
jgi:hypothetical protein